MTNTLYYGDNLDILRQHVPDESVDLVYLDPPFNSNANYNAVQGAVRRGCPLQIRAFTTRGSGSGGRAHLRAGDHHQGRQPT